MEIVGTTLVVPAAPVVVAGADQMVQTVQSNQQHKALLGKEMRLELLTDTYHIPVPVAVVLELLGFLQLVAPQGMVAQGLHPQYRARQRYMPVAVAAVCMTLLRLLASAA
jgi:hypothetical protein